MAAPPLTSWITWDSACKQITQKAGRGQVGKEMEPFLIEALGEGIIRSRRIDWTNNYSARRETELQPEFWRDGGAKWKAGEFEVDIHRRDLENWLNPAGSGGSAGGRKPSHDWDGFWIEMVALANHPDGLDLSSQEAWISHAEEWFTETTGKSPSRSQIGERTSRLYHRLYPGN